MFARFRPRLTFANITSVIALFVALGGSGYAAVTINGKQLKDRSVAGKKLKKDTVGGTEIKESRLGKVPRAKQADSAVLAGSATTANNANALGGTPASAFSCPSGTELLAGSCIETTARAGDSWSHASKACAAGGRHLPTADQLVGSALNNQLTWSGDEWSSDVYYTGTFRDMAVSASGALGDGAVAGPLTYRCALNPVP